MNESCVFFGGTFDPVHNGHLIVARSVAEQLGRRVTLMPTARPPHKVPAQAGAADRLAMLRLAVAGDDLLDVSDFELAREGPTYTFDTLTHLRAQCGPPAELAWIIGTDMLADLPRWHRAAELLGLAKFIVVAREPWQSRMEQIMADLAAAFGPQFAKLQTQVVATPVIEISSTQIRGRVRAGLPIRYLVPPAVDEYIHAHGLYR